jgi:hypothetical protein
MTTDIAKFECTTGFLMTARLRFTQQSELWIWIPNLAFGAPNPRFGFPNLDLDAQVMDLDIQILDQKIQI